MKKYALILLLANASMLLGKPYAEYSLEELVSARIAWAGQENRLGQLLYEAKNISSSKKLEYVNGNQFVATIDASNDPVQITTRIEDGKDVALTMEDFKKMMTSKEVIDQANARLGFKSKK